MSTHLTEYLRSALQHRTQSHFYLIRGNGTLPALVDLLFCEDGFRACGVCRGCALRRSGNLPDLRMIRGDESIKDEAIEELRSFVIRKPAVSRFRVIAIENAHLLTQRAQNRLLKTLEEPPEDLIFLMETTQPERLLETVLSRAIRLNAEVGGQEASASNAAMVSGNAVGAVGADSAMQPELDGDLYAALMTDDFAERLRAFKPYRKNKELLHEQIPLLIESIRATLRAGGSDAVGASTAHAADTGGVERSIALIELLDAIDRQFDASGNADLNLERLMLFIHRRS